METKTCSQVMWSCPEDDMKVEIMFSAKFFHSLKLMMMLSFLAILILSKLGNASKHYPVNENTFSAAQISYLESPQSPTYSITPSPVQSLENRILITKDEYKSDGILTRAYGNPFSLPTAPSHPAQDPVYGGFTGTLPITDAMQCELR